MSNSKVICHPVDFHCFVLRYPYFQVGDSCTINSKKIGVVSQRELAMNKINFTPSAPKQYNYYQQDVGNNLAQSR